jgi:hypothetical protein
MKPSFFKRLKRAVKRELRRIKDEHSSSQRRRKKPPLSVRFKHWLKQIQSAHQESRRKRFERRLARKRRKKIPLSVRFRNWLKKVKEWRPGTERRRPARPPKPPLKKRIKYFLSRQREQYAVVFSSKYLIITLNSTILYLVSFFLVHFITHLVTGFASWFADINTTLYYTLVDFHIRYWNWTPEMVILVFTAPAIIAVLITLLTSIPFVKNLKRPAIFHRLRYLTKKQRHRHHQKQRQKELELQVQRLSKVNQPDEKPKYKKRVSWPVRLFFLWTLYHSATYFFSGMLYCFLFHRRFGYVIWYAFDAYAFDVLFSVIAFLSMIAIGYVFSVQFFHSARMYLNELNDKNRMPFVLSQAIFPFILGTIITVVLQIPKFDLSLILLNFSIFFVLLPLPSRVARFESLHFDTREKTVKVFWGWIVLSAVIIVAILIALKIGIPIRAH